MGDRIVSHYVLESRVGAGGMGEVYRARDLALGRIVAVKLLAPGFDVELKRRLLREAEACARLQHPAIATFYEAGEADGESFIAMEFVTGSTLRELVSRGPLPVPRAIAYTACLLEGLAHAHASGILHRDIKPENIMAVGEDSAKLLDFGLAKRVSSDEDRLDATEVQLTEAGTILGTIGYMSPEQIQGLPVDARCDVFAAGAVLYETFAGRPAFPGRTATERISAILLRDPDPIEAAGVSPALREVVRRALERDPARRYASARAFLGALLEAVSGRPPAGLPDSIAVLELENLAGDPADAWIGSGIGESVAADLSRVSGIIVVPRERVRRIEAEVDPVELGARLGCRWVLSGSFQRMGDALRVVWKLTESSTGRIAATEKLDGRFAEIFTIQDRLAAAVAGILDRRAPEPESAAPQLSAYEFHAKGRLAFRRLAKGSLEEAGELFGSAVERDPGYAPALAGLAAVHAMKFTFTTEPTELAAAEEFALRAIRADPALAEPHVWLGYCRFRQGRTAEAVEEEAIAGSLDPADFFPSYFSACALSAAGRLSEAVPHFQTAVANNPQFAFAWLGLGTAHMGLEHYREARWSLSRAVELERAGVPGAPAASGGYLAECLRRGCELDSARAECLSALDAAEKSDHMYRDTLRAFALCTLGRIALDQGDRPGALAAFRQAEAQLRGRMRALGGGHLLVQALSGLAAAAGDRAELARARALFERREELDFHFFFGATESDSLAALESAAAATRFPRA